MLHGCDYPLDPWENYRGGIVTNISTAGVSNGQINVIIKKESTDHEWKYYKFRVFRAEFKFVVNDTIK